MKMKTKIELSKLPRNLTTLEKIKFYSDLVSNGLSIDELKLVKKRVVRIDVYFDTESYMEKIMLLECIDNFIDKA